MGDRALRFLYMRLLRMRRLFMSVAFYANWRFIPGNLYNSTRSYYYIDPIFQTCSPVNLPNVSSTWPFLSLPPLYLRRPQSHFVPHGERILVY